MCVCETSKNYTATLHIATALREKGRERERRREESKQFNTSENHFGHRRLPNDDILCSAAFAADESQRSTRIKTRAFGQVSAQWTLILQLEALKTENQRLKDENGALIRVISKLSR